MVTPAPPGSRHGNRTTACRWARILRRLGHPVTVRQEWDGGFWGTWSQYHGGWIGITLAVALILTVYSMADYFWSYRALVGVGR